MVKTYMYVVINTDQARVNHQLTTKRTKGKEHLQFNVRYYKCRFNEFIQYIDLTLTVIFYIIQCQRLHNH